VSITIYNEEKKKTIDINLLPSTMENSWSSFAVTNDTTKKEEMTELSLLPKFDAIAIQVSPQPDGQAAYPIRKLASLSGNRPFVGQMVM
jgi:hypothetical protein